MFKNDLKIALRNLLSQKGHSFINIFGLSIGMTCCLLLLLWVQDELSFDRYHEKADRIYRVIQQDQSEGKTDRFVTTPAPLAPALMAEFPGIEKTVRISQIGFLISYKDKRFNEQVFFADPEIFQVFTIPLVKGNPGTALKDTNSILLSEEMAKKYFDLENPMGKILTLKDWGIFKITGVFKDMPRNSHFRWQFLASFLVIEPRYIDQWGISNFWTYILTTKGFSPAAFTAKMPQFVEKYKGKKAVTVYKNTFPLQPLTRIHLDPRLRNETALTMEVRTIYLFSAIALFILLIACLNYINLATARFGMRTKEVGLRKVIGASPGQLTRQFLGESFILALAALFLALLLAKLSLPLFNTLSGKALPFDFFSNPLLIAAVPGIVLSVGLLSGLAPALFIASVPTLTALRGTLKSSPVATLSRRVLVVFQFSISILFITCTLIMSHQLHYMRTKELGLVKEHIVNIHLNHDEMALEKYEILKNEFSRHPDVLSVSASDFFPGRPRWNMNYWHNGLDPNAAPMICCIPVDYDFFDTFQINFVKGRSFSKNFPADENNAFVIDEAALKEFGWGEDFEKELFLASGWKKGLVIGVVRDFHFDSLQKEIAPVVFYIYPPGYEYIFVRTKPGHMSQTIAFLEKKWQEIVPGKTFSYSFLEEDFDRLYRVEFRLQQVFVMVTLLAISIASLGLLGLVVFSIRQRTREVAIRKVLGASSPGIVLLLSKEFTRCVLAANIIAWPIAWIAMNRWLRDFANRIDISLWVFLLAGFLTFFIAFITIGYKAMKASRVNPAETLRGE